MSNITTGQGLLYPFRREHDDFASGEGAELIRSNIRTVIATKAASPDGSFRGEYPWRPDFGSQVGQLLHANLPDGIEESLAKVYVTDAVERWEPRAIISPGDIEYKTVNGGRAAVIPIRFQVDTGQIGHVDPEAVEVSVE
jgi:phage baseplate assembly protein W